MDIRNAKSKIQSVGIKKIIKNAILLIIVITLVTSPILVYLL